MGMEASMLMVIIKNDLKLEALVQECKENHRNLRSWEIRNHFQVVVKLTKEVIVV
jgi:hypothetical protein